MVIMDTYLVNNKSFNDIKRFIENELRFKLFIYNIAWNNKYYEEMYKFLFDNNFKGLVLG